ELLVKIAAVPENFLVMVGPITADKYRQAGLDQRRNVMFTGCKDIAELPAYLKYSHCCIIPFLCNQLTRSIYPLKINEYLSAGKPVVTTNFSEDIATFARVAYVIKTHQEFLTAIGRALAEN